MSTHLSEKDSQTPIAPKTSNGGKHTGPIARLLAEVSKMSDEYAKYQMETGVWRKLAL